MYDKQAIKTLKLIPSQEEGKNNSENQQMFSRQQKRCCHLNNDLFRSPEIWTYQR